MDYVTRQFINLTKKFRRELRQTTSNLSSALHKQTEAIRKANQRRDNEQRPTPEIIATVNLPESISVHQNAKDTRDERNYRRAMFFVTSLTLGAIVIYADLVYWQYREMKTATKAAQDAADAASSNVTLTRENAHLDQRAWIGIGNITGTPSLNEIWKVVVVYHNSGRTPARNIFGHTVAEPVAKGSKPNFSYAHDVSFQGGMVPPNGDYNTSIILTTSKSTGKPSPVIQPMLDSLGKDDLRAYIHGQVDYDDIFGCRHWMTFCYFYNPPTNGFGACTPHNDTGNYECKK